MLSAGAAETPARCRSDGLRRVLDHDDVAFDRGVVEGIFPGRALRADAAHGLVRRLAAGLRRRAEPALLREGRALHDPGDLLGIVQEWALCLRLNRARGGAHG